MSATVSVLLACEDDDEQPPVAIPGRTVDRIP